MRATIDEVWGAMSERELLRHAREGLDDRGFVVWHVVDSRLLAAGLPDVIAYAPSLPGLLLLWELKTGRGRLRAAQTRALAHLRSVPGVDARIVRPADLPWLLAALDGDDPIAALASVPDGERAR
ncbi:MAG TPA: hypothetical protein VF076_07235 [Acidimicrobiales bacterium]